MRFAFLMNLDGAAELARGTEVDPFAALERRPALRAPLAALATSEGLVLARDQEARGLRGRAFLPTPGALRTLARAGAEVPDAPALEVLRAVNHRAFALDVEASPSFGARWITDPAEALAACAACMARAPEPAAPPLHLKRAFSFAGRGHLRVDAATAPETVAAFVERSITSDGGVLVEPEVVPRMEVAIHGFIPHRGDAVLGELTVQRVASTGTWIETVVAGEGALDPGEGAALREAAERAAIALIHRGYHGPFGVDGFRYTRGGRTAFRAASDVNARYTMGFAVGMGDRRPDLD